MALTTKARLGGLATAVGIGGAVATGLAASAAAETATDSERAPAVSSASPARAESQRGATRPAVAVNRGPRPGAVASKVPGASAVSEVSAVSAARAVPTNAVLRRSGPARVASPAVVVPVALAAAAVAPVPSGSPVLASPARRESRVQVPTPAVTAPVSPAAANPVTGFLDTLRQLFCDPRGRQITIYKGTHFAIPNSFGFFLQKVSGTGTFTDNTRYDLGDEDQFDWNKFTGIAFTPLEPDRDSVMVGWRYNLVSGEFEIAPFYNVNKARILPTQQEVISVPVGQTFQYVVDYTGVTLTYGEDTVFKPFPAGLTPNVWTAARVSGWFGGNEVAPRTISYFLKID